MALSLTISTDWGITVPNSYCRVEEVSLVDKENMTFSLRFYAKIGNNSSFSKQTFGCPYVIDGRNPISQAYLHLKSLPEFADAVDC
jgi:hypothetical protein